MKLVMDSDVLIKITKASLKEVITSKFEISIPLEVKNETVDEGKVGGHLDALRIEDNVMNRKLKVVAAVRRGEIERLIESLNLLGGEAGSLRLFSRGDYGAIASDDSKFVQLLESLGIAYMTPGALLIYLLQRKQISRNETLQYLDKIKAFISSNEYMASIEVLTRRH